MKTRFGDEEASTGPGALTSRLPERLHLRLDGRGHGRLRLFHLLCRRFHLSTLSPHVLRRPGRQ